MNYREGRALLRRMKKDRRRCLESNEYIRADWLGWQIHRLKHKLHDHRMSLTSKP